MSIIGSNILAGAAGSGVSAYEIEQSLRFNSGDTHYLNRTPGSAGNRRTWTWSGWFKRSDVSASTGNFTVFAAQQPSGSDQDGLIIDADGSFYILFYSSDPGGSNLFYYRSDRQLRDPSAWYHIMFVLDTTQAAVDDRCNVWINNEKVVDINTANRSALSQNFEAAINNTGSHTIGKSVHASDPGDGYLSEVNFIDGTAYTDATAFGEYDDNGVWRPIKYAGSYTGQSWYLKFASGDGTDSSGLSNTWTANNFTTSGTGTDVMSDTPTTNWCTLNPGYKAVSGATISEGNLKVAYPSAPPTGMHVGTLATTNAFYVEAKATAATSNQIYLGVETPDRGNINNNYPGGGPDGWGYGMNGNIYNNGSTVSSTGTTYTTNDLIGIACDPSSGTIEFFKNGTSVYSGTSVANVPLTICVSQSGGSGNSGTIEINCGQRAYEQTAPSGFSPLNTANLPAPDIADGSKNFNTVLYTATQTAQSITGVGFQPDLVWGKRRNGSAASHNLFDVIRGVRTHLESNTTNDETTEAAGASLTSFDADGFSVGTPNAGAGAINSNSGDLFVAWNWLAGGNVSADNNTDGSITSTVSANPTAGFSIVSYTASGSSGATVGHGLGVAPSFIVVKNRDYAQNWFAYHQYIGGAGGFNFNTTQAAFTSDAGYWNSTNPSSSLITLGNYHGYFGTHKYIAYCFAEVEGYSKFGSYTGNGSTDGTFVYCGFRPAFLMVKRTNTTGNWVMVDATRDPDNVVETGMFANSTYSESAFGSPLAMCDFLSNGFKVRIINTNWNESGNTYIFAAFAENPFGGSGVSPATAR